jgi:hypothetical protein
MFPYGSGEGQIVAEEAVQCVQHSGRGGAPGVITRHDSADQIVRLVVRAVERYDDHLCIERAHSESLKKLIPLTERLLVMLGKNYQYHF